MSDVGGAMTPILVGVAPDHAVTLFGPLLAAIVASIFLRVTRALARAGMPSATGFTKAYDGSPNVVQVAAFLLLVVGGAHLLVVPAHWGEERNTAMLMLLDGLGLVMLAAGTFVWPWWRPAAALLVAATLVTYAFYLVAGWEGLDLAGFGYYLLELVTLGVAWVGAAGTATAGADEHPAAREGVRRATAMKAAVR